MMIQSDFHIFRGLAKNHQLDECFEDVPGSAAIWRHLPLGGSCHLGDVPWPPGLGGDAAATSSLHVLRGARGVATLSIRPDPWDFWVRHGGTTGITQPDYVKHSY